MSIKKNSNENVCKFKSKIGGQALIEGVMMRGIYKSAMVCRLPSGELDLEEWDIKNGPNLPWYRKMPFLRGIFNFVISMAEGYKCLSKSADKSMQGVEDENPSKFEKWLEEKLGDKLMPIVSVIGIVLGVVLAVGLFMLAPAGVTKLIGKFLSLGTVAKTIIEGVVKIAIFVLYMWLTSLMPDMHRTYEYHGAEHKTIACYEAGEELTVENVKKHTRFHPRCGTSFIFIVLIVSIVVFSVLRLPWDNILLRIACKLALLPLIVGIGYEFIRLAGRFENWFTKLFSAPGLAVQRITTKEPDDGQIECAIMAIKAVIPENKEDDVW